MRNLRATRPRRAWMTTSSSRSARPSTRPSSWWRTWSRPGWCEAVITEVKARHGADSMFLTSASLNDLLPSDVAAHAGGAAPRCARCSTGCPRSAPEGPARGDGPVTMLDGPALRARAAAARRCAAASRRWMARACSCCSSRRCPTTTRGSCTAWAGADQRGHRGRPGAGRGPGGARQQPHRRAHLLPGAGGRPLHPLVRRGWWSSSTILVSLRSFKRALPGGRARCSWACCAWPGGCTSST